jgi:hypothetical protein
MHGQQNIKISLPLFDAVQRNWAAMADVLDTSNKKSLKFFTTILPCTMTFKKMWYYSPKKNYILNNLTIMK